MTRFLLLLLLLGMGAASAAPAAPKAAQRPAAPASAPAAEPTLPEDLDTALDMLFERQVSWQFELDKGLDGRLLEAGRSMAAEHLPRVRALMRRWALEAWSNKALAPHALQIVHARVVNAFALWELDSLGAEHDARMLQALGSRSACLRSEKAAGGALEARLHRLHTLAPQMLEQSIADERELLARWGLPRQLPEAVAPVALESTLRALRAGVQQAEPPMGPALAYWSVYSDPATRAPIDQPRARDLNCALHQWALHAALARLPADAVAERRTALARWREGARLDLSDVIGLPMADMIAPTSSKDAHPLSASYFGVNGQVTLEVELDAAGKLLDSRLHKMNLKVEGLPSAERLAIFETMMLRASQKKLQALQFPPGLKLSADGRRQALQTIEWKLAP